MTNAMQITDATFARCQPTSVELHLTSDAELTKRFAKRIKKAGGSYSACRGYQDTRFVSVPIGEVELINELLREFPKRTRMNGGKTCVIFRGGFREIGNIVQYVKPESDDTIETAFATFTRFNEHHAAKLASYAAAEQAEQARQARMAECKAEAEVVAPAMAAIVAELVAKGYEPHEIAGIVSTAARSNC